MIHDARLTAWSLTGPAGGTITLRTVLPEALATATVSVWVGGTADDVDDLTGATEVEAVADGADTTWAVPIPVAVASVPLRWTVDGVPATVGRLVPSRRGTSSADVRVPLVVGDIGLSILLPGAGPDLIPDDSLGILDPDTARQSFYDTVTMFTGVPEEGTEEHELLMAVVDGFTDIIPFYAPEQPTDVAAVIRTLARLSKFLLAQLALIANNDELSNLWTQLGELNSRVSTIEGNMQRVFVQPTDPVDEGLYPTYGSIWIRTDQVPNAVVVRANVGGSEWAQVWPDEPPPE